MAAFKLDFLLLPSEVADAAALASLKVGQRLLLQQQQQQEHEQQQEQQQQEQQQQEQQQQQQQQQPEAAAAAAAEDSAPTTSAPTTAAAAPATSAPAATKPPSRAPLAVCSSSGEVLGLVPADVALRLPPAALAADIAQLRVRSIKKRGDLGSAGAQHEVLLRLEIPNPEARAAGALGRDSRSGGMDLPDLDPTGFQLSRAQLQQLAASEPIRLAVMDERLQRLLTEIDAAQDSEKVLEMIMSRDAAFEAFAQQVLQVLQVPPPC